MGATAERITVAQSSNFKPVWNGKPPADFGTELTQLETDDGAITVKTAQADSTTGDAAGAKSVAETALEDDSIVLAKDGRSLPKDRQPRPPRQV